MSRKQFTALLVLLLIIGGASLIVYKHNSSSWEASPASGKVLGDFALNDVARVVIQTGSATLTLTKKNDTWVVPDRDDYPADFAQVGNLIQTLWQLKPTEDVQAGPSQLGRLELLPPGKGDTTGMGTLIDLQNKDSKRVAALLVGKKFLKKSPQAPDEEGFPAGRYVMPADSSPPKVSLVSEALEQAVPTPATWLDKDFIKIDRIQSVAVDSGTNQWTLGRDSESSTEWNLAGNKPGEKVDPAKIPQFTYILGSPSFTDVMPAATKPEGFDSTVTVTTFDHFTYTLKFGKPDGDNQPMSVSVDANLPKERTPAKNETPDEKKQADQDFAANSKRLTDQLAKYKTFETRIYLVPKTMFDSLLVPRADLLAAPVPAPSPAPADAAPLPALASPAPAASPSPKDAPKKSKSS